MPYSDKHKTIFIHIPKNAGTAITNALEMNDVGHHTWEYYKNKYPEKWNDYKKIAVVRNPWDRVVSNYEYALMEESYWHSVSGKARYKQHPDLDILRNKNFNQCIDLLLNDQLKHQGWSNQYSYIYNDQEQVVDYLINYNNLNQDIYNILGVNVNRLNQSNHIHYQDYYNDDLINKISQIYSTDIKIFNFKYE